MRGNIIKVLSVSLLANVKNYVTNIILINTEIKDQLVGDRLTVLGRYIEEPILTASTMQQ